MVVSPRVRRFALGCQSLALMLLVISCMLAPRNVLSWTILLVNVGTMVALATSKKV